MTRPACFAFRAAGAPREGADPCPAKAVVLSFITILILSLSMSADAFAAAVARGASHRPAPVVAVRNGLVFGLIEATTPIIGWSLGRIAGPHVEAFDHWIAFALLALVGGHMIRSGLAACEEEETSPLAGRFSGPLALVATAIGTSIDAAAVGVGLALIDANIWVVAAAIGATTFAATTIGMLIGGRIGGRFGKRVEIVAGAVLILLGSTILVEHLGLLAH